LNYMYVWKVLEALAIEMKENGLDVPQEAIEDLKSAKTLFSVQQVDPNVPTANAQLYLDRAEATLLAMAESCHGREYAEHWLRKVEDARLKGFEQKSTPERSFIAGVPRGQDWVRIKAVENFSSGDICAVAARMGLGYKTQEHDRVLVYGKPEDIRSFIREIAEKARPKKQE